MNHKSIKQFIAKFYFPNPSWENLPIGFPNCDTKGLTKEEAYLFDAIKFAWITSKPTTSDSLEALIHSSNLANTLINSRLTRFAFTTISSIIIFFSLVSLAYYINVRFNLGFSVLNDIFAAETNGVSQQNFNLSVQTDVGEINLKTDSKDVPGDENPKFNLEKNYSSGLDGIGQRTTKFADNIKDIFGREPVHEVKIEAIYKASSETLYSQTINYESAPGEIEISNTNLKPGTYTLTATDIKTGTNIKQDFNWGVLAINTNKSIYTPSETAKLAIAVLDDTGEMVCNANLRLQISNFQFSISNELSTQNGEIKVNEECKQKEYTLKPDYEAIFEVVKPGIYQMVLTAETNNGIYTITDSFEVKEDVPFDIERIAPTRLFPIRNYPVVMKILAKKDYQGVVEEKMSPELRPYYLTGSELKEMFNLSFDLSKGLIETLPGTLNENEKIIRWHVDWKKDQEYYLSYYIDPPNKSPDFFTLGPLQLKDQCESENNQCKSVLFEEQRKWQLANDVSSGPNNPQLGAENTSRGGTSWTGYTNVYSSNDSDAQVTLTKSTESYYIKASNFGFSLTTCASITGITVEIEKAANNQTYSADGSVRLVNGSGTIVGDDKASASAWPASDTYSTYGGSADTWTASLTCTDVQDVDFGVVISALNTKTGGPLSVIFYVDHIRVTIEYAQIVNDSWTGIAYTDEGTTTDNTASICGVINTGTPGCDSTDASGVFLINTVGDASSGDQLTFFYDYTSTSEYGNTVTVSDGGDIISGDNLKVFKNHVLVRYETGTSIAISQMEAYDNSTGGNSEDMLFDATDSTTDTLTVEDTHELYIPSGFTFAPAGNLESGANGIDDIKIVGTYTAAASETIRVSGSWANSGTFTCSTSSVTFDAPGATTETINSSGAATHSFNNVTFNDGAGGATFQLSSAFDVNGNLTITGGTLDANSQNINVGGNWDNNDIFTSGTQITWFDATDSDNTIESGGSNFSSVTFEGLGAGSGTWTIQTNNATATGTVSIANGDILSIASGISFTHSGTTLSTAGTISGLGTYIYQSATTFPLGGTITANLRMDATNNDQSLSNQNYGGAVELYSNSSSADRTIILGIAASQTLTFNSNLTLNSANTRAITLSGATYSGLTINISGNLAGTSGGGGENITTGNGTWTVTGNVNLTDINTFTATGGTFRMDGTSKTLTSAGESFNNFKASGGSIQTADAMSVAGTFEVLGSASFTHAVGNMTVTGTFTVTSGTFVHGGTTNVDVIVSGNFSIASGANWTENTDSTSQLIFTGDPMSYSDANTGSYRSVGNVQIGNSPGTTNLASDMKANSLTVTSLDYFYTNGYDLDIGNSGITIAGTFDATDDVETDETLIQTDGIFDLQTGAAFTQDQSTLEFTGGAGTDDLITNGSFSLYNLTINGSSASLIVEVEDELDVDNNVAITTGTLDTKSGEGNKIYVGGNWDNDAIFEARTGDVEFNASSGTKTIDALGSGGNYAFNTIIFNNSGGTWQLTTALDANNNFTITLGTVDANAQTINIGNNYSNSGTFTANLNEVIMDAQDAGNTLSGTMTGSSSFYKLTFNDNTTLGAWSFGSNSATVTYDFTITGGAVTAPATGYTLTIGHNFTNSDSFTHNSGTIVFNTSEISTLSYSATTTFYNFTVSTAGKTMKFENSNGIVTDIDGDLILQGTDCSTGRVFLTHEADTGDWDIAAADVSPTIEYVDVGYSNASPSLTAENSTQDNLNNTGWTINSGTCGAHEVRVKGNTRIKGGVRIK